MQTVGFKYCSGEVLVTDFKVAVKRRDAHVRLRRQLVNTEVFRVLAFDALEYAGLSG